MLIEPDIYPYTVTDLSREDALILAPHPDDESLGCGGSIIKHVNSKSRVKIVFLTNGDKGDFEGRFGKDYCNIRAISAHQAMETLGVKDFEFWGYGDREIYLSIDEIETRLIKLVNQYNPSIIYVPSHYEAHPDHRISFKIAFRVAKKTNIPLLLYEVLMTLQPNIIVDITNEIKQKIKAIQKYHTELCYNNYTAKIVGLNKFRTTTLASFVKYAEGFILIKGNEFQRPDFLKQFEKFIA